MIRPHRATREGGPRRDVPVIAIVDDDQSFREALERFLGTCAFRVRSFASGEELLQSTELRFVSCHGSSGPVVYESRLCSSRHTPMTRWGNISWRSGRSRSSRNLWTIRCYSAWCKRWWASSGTSDSAQHTWSGLPHLDSRARAATIAHAGLGKDTPRCGAAHSGSDQPLHCRGI